MNPNKGIDIEKFKYLRKISKAKRRFQQKLHRRKQRAKYRRRKKERETPSSLNQPTPMEIEKESLPRENISSTSPCANDVTVYSPIGNCNETEASSVSNNDWSIVEQLWKKANIELDELFFDS